jgi:hypothetical protein
MKDWARHTLGIGAVVVASLGIGLFLSHWPFDPPEGSVADLRGDVAECAVHGRLLEEEILPSLACGYIDEPDPGYAEAAS